MTLSVSEPQAGSRTKPDGDTLAWTTFYPPNKNEVVFPFFIQWGPGTLHPSETPTVGCSLVKLELHSNDEVLSELINEYGLNIVVVEGSENQIQLRIDSPKGEVLFP